MKKILFDKEIDFSLQTIEVNFEEIGDIIITTKVRDKDIYATFTRFTPDANVSFSIDENLTGIRAQFMMLDKLERKTKSVKPIVCQWCQGPVEDKTITLLRYNFCSAGCLYDFKDHYEIPVNPKLL